MAHFMNGWWGTSDHCFLLIRIRLVEFVFLEWFLDVYEKITIVLFSKISFEAWRKLLRSLIIGQDSIHLFLDCLHRRPMIRLLLLYTWHIIGCVWIWMSQSRLRRSLQQSMIWFVTTIENEFSIFADIWVAIACWRQNYGAFWMDWIYYLIGFLDVF